MSQEKKVKYYCQSCEKEIPEKDQSDSIAYYFAKSLMNTIVKNVLMNDTNI